MQSRSKSALRVGAMVTVCAFVLTSTAAAQGPWRDHGRHRRYAAGPSIKLGALGGATFPLGATKNGIDPGWGAGVLLDVTGPRVPVGFRLAGTYQRLIPSSATANGGVNLWGGDANLLFTIPGRIPLKPYLTAGVGLYRVRNNITESTGIRSGANTSFAWNGGAGLRSDVGRVGVFLEARYLQIFTDGHDIRTMPVTFGLMVGTL